MDIQIDQLIARGRQAFERRDYVAALGDFREVLAERPDFADIRHLTAVCLSFLGQPEAALEEFDRAIDLNDGYVEAHLNRALTLNDLGRYDDAREAFDRAWQAERKDSAGPFSAPVTALLANAHAELGDIYVEAGAPREGVAQYRVALSMRPRFVDIRNKLGRALLELGELADAESELRTALEDRPRFVAARVNLGLLLFRKGDIDAAEQEWQAALAEMPDNAQARAFLAMLGRSPRAATSSSRQPGG